MVPVGIATLLMDAGINTALTKHIAQYIQEGREHERRAAQITGSTINIAVAAALTLIVFLGATPIADTFLKRPELAPLLRVASLAIIGQALLNLSFAIFIGHNRMGLQSLTTIIYAILKAVAMPGLVILGWSSGGAVMGNMASLLVAGTTGFALTLAFMRGGDAKPTAESAKTLLNYGAPIYLSILIGGALANLQSSLYVLYLGETEIGNWGAAQNFGVLVTFLTTPIATTLFPLFSKLGRGTENLKHAYRNAVKYSSLLALPGALALIALAYPMMGIIYNQRYSLAPDYFRLFLLTYTTIGLGSVCQGAILNGQGETRTTFRVNLLVLLVGAPLSLALIPTYGIYGLIAALIISPLPAFIYSTIWIRRNMGLEPDWGSSARIYASSIAAFISTSAITTILPENNWLRFIIGAATYLATYLAALKLTKTLTDEDYKMFRVILGDAGPLAKYLHGLLDLYQRL